MASNVWKQKPNLDPTKFKVTQLGGGRGWTATKIGAPKPPKLPTGISKLPTNELPSNFVNRSGVVGGWKDIPVNMNPADWEFEQNRAGRWFARPVDEMTGLDTATRQQFTNFDNTTNANKTYLTSRVDAAGANANADADAAAKRMASLGNLVSTGIGNPEIAGAQARLAVNSAALANADGAAGVGLARDAAETRLANYTAARSAQREGGLASARNAVQQAAVEQAKFQYQQEKDAKDLAARLRGQSLGLLSDKLQIEGQNSRAQLASDTDLAQTNANNRTRLEIEAAKLQLQAQKLAEKGQAAAAKKKEKAAAAKLKVSQKARADATKMIDQMWGQGIADDAQGTNWRPLDVNYITNWVARQFPALNKEVVRQLVTERAQFAGSNLGYQDYFMRNPLGVR